MNLLKTLSAKTVIGSVAEIAAMLPEDAPEGFKVPLYRVGGIVESSKAGESTKGAFTALIGEFKAIRAEDGEEFVASKCFLPEPMLSLIVNGLKPDKETGEIKPVQFVIDIGLKASKTPTGYEYTCSSVLEVKQTSRLDMLFASDQVKALPSPVAPKQNPATETVKTEVKKNDAKKK